jgi:hypothetical protein
MADILGTPDILLSRAAATTSGGEIGVCQWSANGKKFANESFGTPPRHRRMVMRSLFAGDARDPPIWE